METEILNQQDNRLLERKEVKARISFSGETPKRKELKEAVCGKIGANPDLVTLRNVANEYGSQKVTVSVHIYENPKQLEKVEPRYAKKRERFPTEEAKKGE